MQYTWESKVRLVQEHLHRGTTPEEVLELMIKAGVLTATEEEKDLILETVYSSRNHVYFGGTWDPVGMMNTSSEESRREIKDTLDKLVEDGTITKEFRDRRWEEILKDREQPDSIAEHHKKVFDRIESLLKAAASNGGSQ